MKIDHLVLNVYKAVQEDQTFVQKVQKSGLPYNLNGGKEQKDSRFLIFGLETNILNW